MAARNRILLIDRHAKWLQFTQEALQEQYDVVTAIGLEEAIETCIVTGQSQGFDLVFVGLGPATNGLSIIESFGSQWRFVIMFPVLQEDEMLRIFFKSGAYDCVDKPYEREALLQLVAGGLYMAEQLIRRSRSEGNQLGRGARSLERILGDTEGDDR